MALTVAVLLLVFSLPFNSPVTTAQTVTKTIEVGSSPEGIGVNPTTNKIYVANKLDHTLSVINGETGAVTVTIGVITCPVGVGVNPTTNKIYVTNTAGAGGSSVSVIDGSTDKATKTIDVGSAPYTIGVNPTTNKIYVANSGDENVSIIDGSTDTVTKTIKVGSQPQGVGVNPTTNKIYVVNRGDDNVSVINGSTDTVTATVAVGGSAGACSPGVVVNPTTNKIYVANSGDENVSIIDGSTNTVDTTMDVGWVPLGVDVNPKTNRVYVSSNFDDNVSVIDGSTYTLIATVAVGKSPVGVGVNPTTNRVYVSSNFDDNVSVISVSPTSTYYFAEGTCRPGFDTYICMQNPGSYLANVTLTYMKGDGSNSTQDINIPAHSRVTVRAKDTLGEADDTAHDFSTKVECTNEQQIIAERPMYFNYQGYTQLNWSGGHDVVGATLPSSMFFFAEGTCRPGFDPYICIQNPTGVDAEVINCYMLGNGEIDFQEIAVRAHSRSTVRVKDAMGEGDDASYDFSTIVLSSNMVGIIAERPMYFNYNGWTGGSDVVGAALPSSTYYFAEGTCRPGFDPYLCIQNPNDTDAAVTITYMKGDGTTEVQNVTVSAFSRYTVVVKEKLGEGDDDAHDFSSKVECTNNLEIIAERPMYFNYRADWPGYAWAGGHDVMGAVSSASNFYFAEGTCRPGFDPYLCIQNPNDNDADVTITFMKGDGTAETEDIVISANSRSTVVVKDKLGEGDDAAHDFSCKVKCTNNLEIIAERPMYFNYSGWTGGSDVVGHTL